MPRINGKAVQTTAMPDRILSPELVRRWLSYRAYLKRVNHHLMVNLEPKDRPYKDLL